MNTFNHHRPWPRAAVKQAHSLATHTSNLHTTILLGICVRYFWNGKKFLPSYYYYYYYVRGLRLSLHM